MDVESVLIRCGGVASRADLICACSRAAVDAALREGRIVAGERGRYALRTAGDAVLLANRLHGVLCRESAALHHGWPVKEVPDRPHVSVPTKRKIPPELRALVHLHRDDFASMHVRGIATSEAVTLAQCFRHLPWDAALAVADSALRSGVPPSLLHEVADSLRGPGSPQARRVASAASRKPANVFESVLRALAMDVPGLAVEPQVKIRGALSCQPDLVDARLGIILEADSFAWHGDRAALRRDARRYDLLVADGWLVLRFAWEDVMFDQPFVRRVLEAVVALVAERRQARYPFEARRRCRCCAHRAA